MPPNVLLVVLDSARRDSLEPYGAPAGASPALAQLARTGTALERMFATACWTVPSHVSMFTGLLPRAAGAGIGSQATRETCARAVRAHADRFLPEVLRRSGYQTAAVSANLWLSEASGFSTGFDRFASVDSGRQGQIHADSLGPRLEWALEAARARVDDGAADAERVIRGWLHEWSGEPFFWFVNLVECHSPYLPPRPYNDLSLPDRLRAARDARRHLTLGSIWRACAGATAIPPDALERIRRLYRASIRYMDDWVARILEALDHVGALDDTLVVVTSDHGENLGEGGLIAHALSLDNRLLHVPFVCAGPGAPADGGVHSLAELPRILAAAAGIAEHPWPESELPRDAAVAELHPPVSADDAGARARAEAHGFDERSLSLLTTGAVCATDGRWKLVERDGERRLYDLSADPLELHPTPLDGRRGDSAIDSLAAALAHPALSTAGAPPAAPAKEPAVGELEDIEARMRLLGYL